MTFTAAELAVLKAADAGCPSDNLKRGNRKNLTGRPRKPFTAKEIATARELFRRGWNQRQVQAYLKCGTKRFNREYPKDTNE